MTKDTIKRIRLIYGILLSISIIIAGILLIAACIGIYVSGDQPFSREAVTESFAGIALPVYVCLAMVIGGFILDFALPGDKKRLPAEKQYGLILARLCEKTDLSQCDPVLYNAIQAQRRSRRLHWSISAVLLVIGSVVFLTYGTNPNNFHQSEINASMIRAMYVLLPCLAVPFGYAVFSAFYSRSSIQKEIALVRQANEPGCKKTAQQARSSTVKKPSGILILRCTLLVIGVAMLLYGFFAGGTADVLTKAVNICTECVGLG